MNFWVMHSMVMDETLHVFPAGEVCELFRVCQQEVFLVYPFSMFLTASTCSGAEVPQLKYLQQHIKICTRLL